MRRTVTLLAALTLLAAACGDDGGSILDPTTVATSEPPATTSPPTTQAPPTTEAPASTPPTTEPPPPPATTTTTLPPTTTTTEPPMVYEVDEVSFFPDPLPGSDDAHGSGCVVPGGSMTLPDGIWFGFAEGVSPGELTFDLACFWTGAAAEAEATADGEEAFDFYIRNQNPTNRQVPISGSARFWYLDATGDLTLVEIAPGQWPHPSSFLSCPGEYCSVWLYVNGGRITGLVEQYLP